MFTYLTMVLYGQNISRKKFWYLFGNLSCKTRFELNGLQEYLAKPKQDYISLLYHLTLIILATYGTIVKPGKPRKWKE